ncbi:hypothetical protein EAI_17545 [Harpegnathos saltator]|uniref:Transposable element P transposase-like RNase H domain-containing protein n=1 Tax=Harpegnathos saltator TaxID=610380 RepID=E2B2G3_HARSA|nr:hypothetical protein EAI_17545 [Harpegnathos saltator]
MSIKPGLQYDNSSASVIGRSTMKLSGEINSSNKQATHSLVFILCGISTKWKQTIAYKFTANSFCPHEMVKEIETIIQKAHFIGLTIKVVISAMSALNRSWWKILNITGKKWTTVNNYIQHPCDKKEKLYIMPDSVHVFKNVACSLTAGNTLFKCNISSTIQFTAQ